MARKRLAAEQIVTKLRQIEVLQAQGKTIPVACKEAGTAEQSFETNVSTAKFSTVSRKPKWSLRNGVFTIIQSTPTPPSATGRQHHSQSRQSRPHSTRPQIRYGGNLPMLPIPKAGLNSDTFL